MDIKTDAMKIVLDAVMSIGSKSEVKFGIEDRGHIKIQTDSFNGIRLEEGSRIHVDFSHKERIVYAIFLVPGNDKECVKLLMDLRWEHAYDDMVEIAGRILRRNLSYAFEKYSDLRNKELFEAVASAFSWEPRNG